MQMCISVGNTLFLFSTRWPDSLVRFPSWPRTHSKFSFTICEKQDTSSSICWIRTEDRWRCCSRHCAVVLFRITKGRAHYINSKVVIQRFCAANEGQVPYIPVSTFCGPTTPRPRLIRVIAASIFQPSKKSFETDLWEWVVAMEGGVGGRNEHLRCLVVGNVTLLPFWNISQSALAVNWKMQMSVFNPYIMYI